MDVRIANNGLLMCDHAGCGAAERGVRGGTLAGHEYALEHAPLESRKGRLGVARGCSLITTSSPTAVRPPSRLRLKAKVQTLYLPQCVTVDWGQLPQRTQHDAAQPPVPPRHLAPNVQQLAQGGQSPALPAIRWGYC